MACWPLGHGVGEFVGCGGVVAERLAVARGLGGARQAFGAALGTQVGAQTGRGLKVKKHRCHRAGS